MIKTLLIFLALTFSLSSMAANGSAASSHSLGVLEGKQISDFLSVEAVRVAILSETMRDPSLNKGISQITIDRLVETTIIRSSGSGNSFCSVSFSVTTKNYLKFRRKTFKFEDLDTNMAVSCESIVKTFKLDPSKVTRVEEKYGEPSSDSNGGRNEEQWIADDYNSDS